MSGFLLENIDDDVLNVSTIRQDGEKKERENSMCNRESKRAYAW